MYPGNHFIRSLYSVKVKVARSCPTLSDPMDCTPRNSLGQSTRVGSQSLLQGIFPSSQPRYRTQVSCIAGQFFISEPPGTPEIAIILYFNYISINLLKTYAKQYNVEVTSRAQYIWNTKKLTSLLIDS